MAERPILMSAPMVVANLREIDPKTQTRRVVKWRDLQPGLNLAFSGLEVHSYVPGLFTLESRSRIGVESRSSPTRCPYGQAGDRLWVRETWAEVGTMDPGLIVYRADYPECVPRQYENVPPASEITWKPSIHMFRKDSRIDLEITGIRVERLQGISEADARAEGIVDGGCTNCGNPEPCGCADPAPSARDSYCRLWDQINGAGSWAANPFVWVVEFNRVKP